MQSCLFCLFTLRLVFGWVRMITTEDTTIQLLVNELDGSYSCLVDGHPWLRSGPTAIHVESTWFASSSIGKTPATLHSLVLTRTQSQQGGDLFGPFESIRLFWL